VEKGDRNGHEERKRAQQGPLKATWPSYDHASHDGPKRVIMDTKSYVRHLIEARECEADIQMSR